MKNFNDPLEIHNQIWSFMEKGVKDRNSAFHTPTLITLEDDNNAAARTLVLREVNKNSRTFRFHSDQRSKKIEQVHRNPNALIHVYSQEDKLQLRFKSKLSLHINEVLVDEAWEKSYGMSKICYQVDESPGSQINIPDGYQFTPEKNHEGKDNFIVIIAKVIETEWLYLSCDGHRRAKFTYDNEVFIVSWLVP